MTPRPPAISQERIEQGGELPTRATQSSQNRLSSLDRLGAIGAENAVAKWANRAIVVFILLFALTVPHSIAAAQISFTLGMIFWGARDLASRKFHFARLPVDWPLLAFASLTALSSALSFEPGLSLPKLKGLTLFGVIYLLGSNLHPRAVPVALALLLASGLAGVGYSFAEKIYGRGMVITAIHPDSPLEFKPSQTGQSPPGQSQSGKLQPGDVIWMVARKRVYSPEDVAAVIRKHRPGDVLDVEALHAGDPVPTTVTVTEELMTKPNPLGVEADGRSRQFRVSGFSRQFLTYAEQMQILGMLAFGALLAAIRAGRRPSARTRLVIFSILFPLFALALLLTASRAVIAAFIGALLFVSVGVGGRSARILALIAALFVGVLGYYAITTARQPGAMSFNDDSASRRVAYMRAGLRLIPKHPLLGVGMDSHKLHWREWGFPGDYITHTHSTPIQVAMDRGLPALACYFWLIAAMLTMSWRGYRRAGESGDGVAEGTCLGCFGALIGFTLSSFTNYNFGDSETLMLLLFVTALGAVQTKFAKLS
jgi:hypothetical protein